jgi:translation initiation factor 1
VARNGGLDPWENRGVTDRGSRLVYSSDQGRTCPKCGWPSKNCQCSTRAAAEEAVPTRVTAKLRMEKKGRGGKTMTVVDGLPRNTVFLKDLCAELKRFCGTGGAVEEGAIELQGDLRERLRPHLAAKGFIVKG